MEDIGSLYKMFDENDLMDDTKRFSYNLKDCHFDHNSKVVP